jgi:hypothetical protein
MNQMKNQWFWAAGLALSLTFPTAASAKGIEGLWRFDIINSAGTTLGAMTIQSRDTIQRQENAQHDWAMAKGRGADASRSTAHSRDSDQPGLSGYTGFAITDQGGHALPIESIDMQDGQMTMVVNSPRGLVIFRGTIDRNETRFDGKLTYHNGSVFTMRGVRQARLP